MLINKYGLNNVQLKDRKGEIWIKRNVLRVTPSLWIKILQKTVGILLLNKTKERIGILWI